jgi:predicted amidohydrolase YtcJ
MVHDAGMDLQIWSVLRELRAQGRWKLRVYAMLTGAASFLMEELRGRAPELDPVLTLRAVKVYLDGALGSRGAWLLEPYSDRPDTSGLNLLAEEQFRAIVRAAAERGWQVAVHAIGDRANRLALDVFHGVSPEARMRVEHAQVVVLEDLPRFAQQGVIASIQPTHATSDMNMAEERVGPRRIRGAYAWRSLLDSGAVVAAGSDFPVESHNPLWGVYAAVTRQDHEGNPPGGWYPEQRMTVEEALRAFTIGAAYAAFREHDLGRLMPGYFADFTAYDIDVLRCEPREWLQVRPRMVAIGGEVVYRR